MKTRDFDYQLPDELIAQHPLPERSDSRLLCLDRRSGELHDCMFTELLQRLQPGDLLVFNDTKVIPARLHAHKVTGGRVEVFIERVLSRHSVKAMLKSSKAVRIGQAVLLDGEAVFFVAGKRGMFYLLESPEHPIDALLQAHGHVPLPPYIQRADEAIDANRYQTVYAQHAGAVAAPTAGLHFSEHMLQQLKALGVHSAFVTLHVGAGTFQPVKTDDVLTHRMHKEWLNVSADCVAAVQQCRRRGGRVIAVGTTAVRSLETAARSGTLAPYCGDTDVFIYPGHRFQVIDGLITNFHLPQSTLLMLVSALAGREAVLRAYAHAVAQRYRFFSYGDAMLIL